MQTRHQYRKIGLGLKTRNRNAVTRIFRASAQCLRSVQWEKGELAEKTKESGKTVGNAAEVSPWAVRDRKSVKFPVNSNDPHPPVESLNRPLPE